MRISSLDLIWEDGFIMENDLVLNEVASVSNVPIIIGCIRAEKTLYTILQLYVLMENYKNIVIRYSLPNYDVFDEKRFFHSGQTPKVFKIPINDRSRKIGIQICEDMWDDDYNCKVSTLQKEMGAELIINISASPYHENKISERIEHVSLKAKQLRLPFIYCNMIGGQKN